MLISEVNNFNQNTNFRGYSILPKGKDALKKLTDPAMKREYIDLCKYFENKKYTDIKIDADDMGRIFTYIKIPEVPDDILAAVNDWSTFHLAPGASCNCWWSHSLGIKCKEKTYWIKFPNRELHELAQLGHSWEGNMFQKIKSLGSAIEDLHLDMEEAENLNKELDTLA